MHTLSILILIVMSTQDTYQRNSLRIQRESTLESEAWCESGDGWWRAGRGNPMDSHGSEAVARRKENSNCSLLLLGTSISKLKLPLRLRSCTY